VPDLTISNPALEPEPDPDLGELVLGGGLKMQDWKMEEQIWGQASRWKMRDRKMEDQKMEDQKLQDQVLERKMQDNCR